MRSHLKAFSSFRLRIVGSAASTVDSYSGRVAEFISWRERAGMDTEPDTVVQSEIDAWLQGLAVERGNCSSTLAAKLMALRAFFRYLVYTNVLIGDPTGAVPVPRRRKRTPKKFTTSQLKRLFHAPDITKPKGIRDRALLMTIYGAGLRKHESVGLALDDIEDTGAHMFLTVLGKGGKERLVTLRRKPATMLRQWLLERPRLNPADRSVFIRVKGVRVGISSRRVTDILKDYARKMGIPEAQAFVHKLRSTWASDLHDQDVDIMDICAQAGWASPDSAKPYIVISEKARKKAAISDKRWAELTGKGDEDGI